MTTASDPTSQPSGADPSVPAARTLGLSKSYGSVRALSDVDFEVFPGEVVALVGDNGAGKSTFVKLLSGAIEPTAGEVYIDGESVDFATPADARARGIETVYQDLALVGHIDVGGNLFLGREPTRGGLIGRMLGILDLPAMAGQARRSLEELKVTVPSVTSPVGTMSGGQRQATAIARTAMWGSKLLILDEPTAALGIKESEETLKLIEDVAAKRIPLIVVSHNIEHVFRIATRIVVFRQGRLAADLVRSETTPDEVVGYITGSRA